ncbi:DUF2459 domain-containing protein [Croceicoccus mobilis]|uniref:TIGR02117 family protein n=1 Tax=Croceicoccus mobilis TaxID=1703339 RepID=A0A916YPG5_9SPHN|nr:DUF2459 domain-containing protein [Croceicoccus mobilis]GGD55213.1 hypothetical protein GCM10010990_00420 [Croceicoccus mobilis]
MAAPTRRALIRALKRTGRIARAVIGWAALLLGAYFFAGWVGSSIPSNRDFRQAADGVEIMIGTNGVHTMVVVPIQSPDMDWSRIFPASELADPSRPYTHLGISWGQKEVFIDTPTWADLSPWLVLRVVALGGDGLMHVEHWVNPQPGANYRPLRISHDQYRALVRALLRDLPPRSPERQRYPGYGTNDVFYDARGTYTAYLTCNEWTGATLRQAGLPTGAWTPFESSVMKWVPQPEGGGTR